jgi:DNA modification methylase
MIIEIKKISELTPAPYNPRESTEKQESQLKQSLKKFGVVEPIIYNKQTGYIVGGHFRVRELQKLGYTEIECVIVDLSEEDEKELNIRLNANTGQWDWDELANNFELDDLNDWGLEVPNMKHELEAEEDDFEINDAIETDIVLGDLFEIGEHRLLCGDSTDSDAVARLMNGEKADMAHNDPPYGMKKENEGVLNDNLNYSDLLDFNREWIDVQFMNLKENGSWYCWGIDEPLMDIYSEILKPYIAEQKATFRNLITWDKGNGQGQNSENTRSYAIADEKCLFAMMGVQGFNNNADNYFKGWDSIVNYLENEKNKAKFTIKDCKRLAGHSEKSGCHWFDKSQWMMPTKQTYDLWRNYCIENNIDAFKKEYEEIKKEYEIIKKEYYSTRAYFNNTHDNFNNVWKFDRHLRNGSEGGHATPKPIPLCERAIKSSCPDGGLVMDVFLGSGSTMVASHQLKRKCYGMELDPKYCQVIIDRMKNLDPTIKIKRNGVEI